jgi:4-cresol dehydrogenase (hydroxylating)
MNTKKIFTQLQVLFPNSFINDTELLNKIAQATFPFPCSIIGVVYPTTSREVQQIMLLANEFKVSVYVVSQGKNWGLGSKVPISNDCLLIDLQRMNKISDFDEEMAHITVEAGVTFKDVFEYLAERESKLMLDGIGSTQYASIVGNTVERGHGMAMYADRFANVCAMEVVLPTGEIIHTGFERYADNKLAKLSKWGLGAYIDGLFTQSNFGIVTKLTLWLKPQPAYFQTFMVELFTEEQLSAFIDEARSWRLTGMQISLRVFNDVRMIAFGQRFPFSATKEWTETVKNDLKTKINLEGNWIALGGNYALSAEHGKADKQIITHFTNKIKAKVVFYDEDYVKKSIENGVDTNKLDFIYTKSVLRGYVSDNAVQMCYWRKPHNPNEHKEIHEDKCGVLWYCPCIPNRGEDVLKTCKVIEDISAKYDLEPNYGFLCISERALDVTGAICYDRQEQGADDRAMLCHDEIMNTLLNMGYAPYRLGIQSMHYMQRTEPTSMEVLHKIKSILDPNNILSVGRYL